MLECGIVASKALDQPEPLKFNGGDGALNLSTRPLPEQDPVSC